MITRRRLLTGMAGLTASAALLGRTPSTFAQSADLAAMATEAEGQTLNLIIDPPQAYRDVAQIFAAKFPGVGVQTSVMHPSDATPRLITEQQNNLFAWDAWWGTCTNMNSIAAPAGILADIGEYLVLAEVKDVANWRLPDMMFTSSAGKFVFVHNLGLINQGAYHSELVPNGVLTLDDLLDPSLRGMISIRVPSRPHGGSLMLTQIAKEKGFDFVEELLRTMEPVYVDNDRQNTDSVIRGDTAVGIGTSEETLFSCHSEGGCVEIKPFPTADMQARGVSVLRDPPNREATVLWVNWLLSRDGQETFVREWAKTNFGGAHSLRHDVAGDPKHAASLPNFGQIDRYSAVSYDSGWAEVQRIIELHKSIEA